MQELPTFYRYLDLYRGLSLLGIVVEENGGMNSLSEFSDRETHVKLKLYRTVVRSTLV